LKSIKLIQSFELFPKHYISYAVPENFNEADKSLFYDENFSFDISAINQLELKHASLSGSLVFQKKNLLFDLTRHQKPALIDLLKSGIRLSISKKGDLNSAILGFQEWGNNYFHWMTEMLPRIVAMKYHHPLVPVVIPSNYLKYPFIVESLALLKIDFKTFDIRQALKIDMLYAISVTHVGRFNEGLMHFFQDKFIHDFTQSSHPERLVYITRGKARRRRVSNEDQVFELLVSRGFEKITLEDLHLKDQVQLFQEAKVVVASHGAGLTNIMFMQKGQTVIELKSDNNNYWCYFSLARVYGLKYFYNLSKGSSHNHRDADILVDIDQLKKIVTQAINN
jgi:capsular polysaccharide biosynthesis protein